MNRFRCVVCALLCVGVQVTSGWCPRYQLATVVPIRAADNNRLRGPVAVLVLYTCCCVYFSSFLRL